MLKNQGIFYIFLAFLCWGCSVTKLEVARLDLPQDASYFLKKKDAFDLPDGMQEILKSRYLQSWYSPWNTRPNPNRSEVFWIAPSLLKNLGYGPNLKAYTLKEMQDLYDSMDMENYPSSEIKAIVIQDTNVRAVPTILPRFKSPSNYPFDRWQNSLILKGTPVLITHYNITRDWAHVQSSFVYGWIKVEELAKITPEDEDFLKNIKDYVIPNQDKIPIYDDKGEFLSMARMGGIFALKEEKDTHYIIYLAQKSSSGFVKFKTASVPKVDFSLFPKKIDTLYIAEIIDSMMGQFYGWGGEFQSRDCSAFIRDSFSNFGIYLPRNSAAQAKYANNMIDLRHLNAKQKEQYILKNATPFLTILWLKGHIMLYIGEFEGRAVVAHSAWSVITKKNFSTYENLLGGVVITTLTPANHNSGFFFKSQTLLDKILGMSDLYTYIIGLANTEG